MCLKKPHGNPRPADGNGTVRTNHLPTTIKVQKGESETMTNLTQKLSKRFFGAAMRVVTLALFLVVFGASAVLAQTRAYVTNQNDNTVSVIDTATNTVVATVPVGSGPWGVAVTPNEAFAYVVNRSSNNVSVISAATNTVVGTVPVGLDPRGIAITPNGAFAYVANRGDDTVSVISTAANTVTATVPVGNSPNGIAITPNGAFAYLTHDDFSSPNVTVIDTATNTVAATVPLAAPPTEVAITPNGAFAYVVIFFGGVSVISTATNTVVATVTVGNGAITFPAGIAITPNGAFAYVSSSSFLGSDLVSVIDTATNTVTTTVGVGSPFGVAITPNGAFAYVANSNVNTVSVIDTTTNAVTATIPVGSSPLFIAFPVRSPTQISGCTTINFPGHYDVVANLTSSSTCIRINASHVKLNLNGHTITGPSGAVDNTQAGILVVGQTKVEIDGPGLITNFGRGVDFEGVDFSDVIGVTATGNFFGFSVNRDFATPNLTNLSEKNSFSDNTATGNNQHGFSVNGGSNNNFLNNVASSNGFEGILLADGTGNQLKGNTTNGNGEIGIEADGASTGHSIRGNTANGNLAGIVLFNGSTGNTVKGNTTLNNLALDLFDENANCDSNIWTNNVFNIANQACIH
jgi:YVTN family beta-propeller protein/parallel beta-helix repeat protein